MSFFRGYRYFRWLSLDVVLGANLLLAFFGQLYQLIFSIHIYIALSIAVWLIYTCDHLADVVSSKRLSSRRKFHQAHFRMLVCLSGLVLVMGLINIAYLPIDVIRMGALLAAGCVAYLMAVYFFKAVWFKELMIAVGYATGIFLSPLVLKDEVQWMDYLFMVQLGVLALANLLIFSHFERQEDQENGWESMAIKLHDNAPTIIRILLFSLISSTVLMAYMIPAHFLSLQVIYLLMAVVLFAVLGFDGYFRRAERFRVVGDAIFYWPVVFLF